MQLRKLLSALAAGGALIALPMPAAASQGAADTTFTYRPTVHGAVRARWEVETETSLQRFQVRNTYFTIAGNAARWADYFLYADVCDRGSIKVLDAWARLRYDKLGLSLQAGQLRMPFGIDISRQPRDYFFSNRSFIGKELTSFRGVGVKAAWAIPMAPVTIEAGVFNTTPIGNHVVWNHGVNASAKATARWNGFLASAAILTVNPHGKRSNLVDATLGWSDARWHVEAEYVRQHYCDDPMPDTNGYNTFVCYTQPLPMKWFNRLSVQARYDGMSALSHLEPDAAGALVADFPSRRRFTAGVTAKYLRTGNMFVALRFDYEKYFYKDGVTPPEGQGDKFVTELILSF